jgi:hypothetical protein
MLTKIFRDELLKFSHWARERAAITVETLIAEAEEARSKAMDEKGGAAAAVAAITAKAKLAGLWREKVAQTDPSGENAPRYIISDHVMSEEEWDTRAVWGMNVFCVHLRSLALSVPARTERRSPTHDFHRPLNTDLRRLFTGPASATNFWTDSSSLITVPGSARPIHYPGKFCSNQRHDIGYDLDRA